MRPFSAKRSNFDMGAILLMTSAIIEVAQQSKARRKDDFLIAFSPVIAEATATAYKGATNEVQQKLRRVVEVWRARQIFELPIQEAIEARIDGKMS
jgi:regulator of Ty1 transposition protein 103